MHTAARIALVALLAVLPAACRSVAVQTDTRAVASVEVVNQTGTAMLVYYDAGAGAALLGSVPDGGTERFIVTAPPGASINVTGRSESGTRTAGPIPVTLVAGATQRVTLR